jgi:hypothetical protein
MEMKFLIFKPKVRKIFEFRVISINIVVDRVHNQTPKYKVYFGVVMPSDMSNLDEQTTLVIEE